MIRGGLAIVPVRDVERAVRFYVETLGMKLVESADGVGQWQTAVLDAGSGFCVKLCSREADSLLARQGGSCVVLFVKESVDESIAILENRGLGVVRTPGSRLGFARTEDLDGNVLVLRQSDEYPDSP